MNEFGTFDTEMLGITEDQIREVDASEAEVVSRVLTPRVKDIMVTFRPDGITFNTTCVRSMIDVVFVQMYIDRKQHRLYVAPCMEYDKNSKQWCNVKNDTRVSRKITGKPFGNKAYQLMGWSKGYSYRVVGYPARQEGTEDEYLLVFDLDVYERTLLTEKGLIAAGVDDSDLGESAEQIHADIAQAQAEKERAKEEAKASGRKRRLRKKVEYYDGVAGDSFGPRKQDYSEKVSVPMLEQMEMLGSDSNDAEGTVTEPEQGNQPETSVEAVTRTDSNMSDEKSAELSETASLITAVAAAPVTHQEMTAITDKPATNYPQWLFPHE